MCIIFRLVGTPTERMWPEMRKLQGYKVSCNFMPFCCALNSYLCVAIPRDFTCTYGQCCVISR